MAKVIPNVVFEDYEPPSDLVTEEGCDTLLIYLPGFKKEQLKVQLTISRMLKISGERPLGDNKYRRFQKEFRLPSNCDNKDISAKFEGGILYIRQPKITAPAAPPPPQQPPAVQPPKTPRPQQPPPPPQPPAVQPPKTPRPQQPPPPQPPAVQPPKTPRPQQPPAVQPPKSPRPQQPPRQPPQVSFPPPQAQPPPPPQLRSQQQALPSPPPPPPQQPPQLNQGFPEEHREEEQRAEGKRKEEEMRRKEEESSNESGVVQRPKQEVAGSGLFRELKKPDNVKRLGVSILLVLLIAFYISYMFKSLVEYDQEIMSEYHQEL